MGKRTNPKTYLVVLVFLVGTVCTNAMGGTTFLIEDFESAFVSGAPPGWTKSFKTGTVDWARNIGDHSSGDAAHGGTYNAMLYYDSTSDHETYLITPVIDLGGATNTTLEFWHKQANWAGDQDTLKVYYKTSAGGSWILLVSYLSDVSTWTKRTISLPNPCSTYYIGFLGNAKYGYGVCIDDVKVYESGGDGVTNYHAVVCGIENYQGSMYDLNYCHEDADGFRYYAPGDSFQNGLLSWPNWNSANITLLKYSVTKSQIQTAIQNMCAAADEDDVCVFYFAGHGTAGPDVYPYDEDDWPYEDVDEYLVTYDGLVWDSYWDEYYVDFDKCIRDDEFGNWMADLPTDKYAVFLDACYSGGQIKGLAKVRGIGDIVPAKGDGFAADLIARMKTRDLDDNGYGVVVTACDDDETCEESHSLEHGIFTYCLLIGMGGAADDNSNDRISAEECNEYAYPCTINYNPDQHPQMYDGHAGELDFLELPPCVYCSASGGCDEYISRVEVGDIDNSSGCDGYADYTAMSTIMQIGQSYHIKVTNGNGYSSDKCGIWLDWNQDKVFDHPGELVLESSGYGPYEGDITVPGDANLGDTRIRIRIQYAGTLNPCGDTTWGEVEDYTITVNECELDAPVLHVEPNITPGLRNTISWDPVADANGYYAQCANDANFANVVTGSGWISETSYTFKRLDLGRTYWYRVKAIPQFESWSQTSQAEFQTDTLIDTLATNDGDVVLAIDVLATDTLGNADSNGTYSQQTTLNVIECNETALLTEIEMYLGIASSQTLQFIVYETPSESGGYGDFDLIHSNLITSGTGTGWYNSGPILVPLVADKSYCIGVAWDGEATFYCDFGAGPENISWGRKVSGKSIAIYPAPNSVSVIAHTGTSYYQNLITSGYSPSGSIVSTEVNLPADGNWVWAAVCFDKTMPSDTALSIDVLNAADDSVILADVASGTELSGIAATSIKLRANLSTDDPNNNTPVLHDWSVSYLGPCECESDWSNVNVEFSLQCDTLCDFDNNNEINFADFAILAGQWLQVPGSPSADIAPEVPDDFVDFLDLEVFVENWLLDLTCTVQN